MAETHGPEVGGPAPRPPSRWSLRRRVMVETLSALAIVIVLGLAVFSFALERILIGVAEADARGQVDEISVLVEHGDLTPERMREEVASHGSIMQILDSHGRVLQASPERTRTQPMAALTPGVGVTQSARVSGVPASAPQPWLVVARGVQTAAGPRAAPVVVLVAAPLASAAAVVRMTLWWFAGAGGVLLVVVGVLQWRGISAALEPVRRITAEVEEIRHARSAQRVTEPRTDDEIARLADVMNQMLDRLDRADSATRRFISDASHELRSPLTTIRAVIEGEASPPGTRAHERDLVIHAEALRMQRLVDDLLTLAKSDDAGLDLAREEVDLDAVVEQEVARLRATSSPPSRPLLVRARVEPARVLGDEQRLAQVIRNLTDNAARHAAGVIDVQLRVDHADGGRAVLTVDNDGDTIPPGQRKAVFERFVRLSTAREREGTSASGGSGLGLSIARAIVTLHGGSIAVVDRGPQGPEPGGCRLEVRLPLAPGYLGEVDDGAPDTEVAGTIRYPAPRTVSNETTPKASSILRRR